jgi:hypothetical protein
MWRGGGSSGSEREPTCNFLLPLLYFIQCLVYLRPQTRVLRFRCGYASVRNLLQRHGGNMVTVNAVHAPYGVTGNVRGGPRLRRRGLQRGCVAAACSQRCSIAPRKGRVKGERGDGIRGGGGQLGC